MSHAFEHTYSDEQTAELLEQASIDRRTLRAAFAGAPMRAKTRKRLLDALLRLDLEPPPKLALTAGERQAFERRLVGSLTGSSAHGS